MSSAEDGVQLEYKDWNKRGAFIKTNALRRHTLVHLSELGTFKYHRQLKALKINKGKYLYLKKNIKIWSYQNFSSFPRMTSWNSLVVLYIKSQYCQCWQVTYFKALEWCNGITKPKLVIYSLQFYYFDVISCNLRMCHYSYMSIKNEAARGKKSTKSKYKYYFNFIWSKSKNIADTCNLCAETRCSQLVPSLFNTLVIDY